MGMTMAGLTAAIQRHIDKEMEKSVAESMAEHALGFFGYYDRIIDNALEPTDRNLFYIFQDYNLLTTESEETTLWDGREWRIHYWLLKVGVIQKRRDEGPKYAQDEVEPSVYDEVPEDIWSRKN